MARLRLSPAERRERIIDAARDAFATHGFEAASMRQIAAAAEVTTPVIYDHFRSKQQLYIELLEAESQALIAATSGIRPEDETAEAWIAAGVDAFFRFAEQRPHAWRILFHEVPADSTIADVHRAMQQGGDTAIMNLLKHLPAVKQVAVTNPETLEMLAVAARSSVNGLAQWWWDHPETPRTQVVATAVHLLTRGLAHN